MPTPTINMNVVDYRKSSLEGHFDNSVVNYTASYNYILKNYDRLNKKALLEFLKSNNSVEKINSNYNKCITVINSCKESAVKEELLEYFNTTLLPKIKDMKSMRKFECLDENTIQNYIIADRIINNDRKINNRFNTDKIVSKFTTCEETVNTLCELIDTYNMSEEAKFNIALEHIIYANHKNRKGYSIDSIIESVCDYFLYRDNIIKDSVKESYEKVLRNNKIIQCSNITGIMLEKLKSSNKFDKKINKIVNKLKDKNNTELVESIRDITTEKQAYSYIQNIIFNYQNNVDYPLLLKSIFLIPLLGHISWQFISIEVKTSINKANAYKKLNKAEIKDIQNLLDSCENEDVFLEESCKIINEAIKDETDFFGNYYKEEDKYLKEYNYKAFIESKDFADSDDIKELLDKFKNESDKSPSRFKNLITKLYTKNPEDIIDGFPSILNLVRYSFILSTAVIPLIGPVITGILLLVDKLISMNINEKEATKLYKYLIEEKKKIEEKKDKLTDDKKIKQTEEYINCLKKCIEKVESYIESIDDSNEDLYTSSDDDFDMDWDLDENFIDMAKGIGVNSILENSNIIQESILDRFKDPNKKMYKDTISKISDDLSTKHYNRKRIISRYETMFEKIIDKTLNNIDGYFRRSGSSVIFDTKVIMIPLRFSHDNTSLEMYKNNIKNIKLSPSQYVISKKNKDKSVLFIQDGNLLLFDGSINYINETSSYYEVNCYFNLLYTKEDEKYTGCKAKDLLDILKYVNDFDTNNTINSYNGYLKISTKKYNTAKVKDILSKYNNTFINNNSIYIFNDSKLVKESTVNISLLTLNESMNIISELLENRSDNSYNIMNGIRNNLDTITESIDNIVDVGYLVMNCPNTLSIKKYTNMLKDYRSKTYNYSKSTNIIMGLDKLEDKSLIRESNIGYNNIYIEKESLLELNNSLITEEVNINNIKLAAQAFKKKIKDLNTKQKAMWQSLDATMSTVHKSIKNALTSDRREAIIKGSVIPSFSKCVKNAMACTAVGVFTGTGPVGAVITAIGLLGASKVLNDKERQLIYDEIDTELQVVEKQISIAENDGDMNQYRFLLQYQKKLLREKQRIKYHMNVRGRNIPDAKPNRRD